MNEAGVPPGAFNVVHGFGPDSAGEALTRHKGVDAITFTGETRTGAAIMAAAAQGVRVVSFELGGKNAAIVFADADLDAAIEGIGRAVFLNCGQVCLGTERVYVERALYAGFVDALRAYAVCCPCQRYRARALDYHLDARSRPRASRRTSRAGRHHLGE